MPRTRPTGRAPRALSGEPDEVYLIRGGHLVPVPRSGRSVADALGALSAGPTALDVDAELRSPLPALPVDVVTGQDPDTIAVPAGFATLPARDQFLAAGQLVWTATELCCAT